MIKKFEEKYKVKVTDHRLRHQRHRAGQGRAGGHGFDIVVPSANFMPIWIEEGLLLETRPDQMENFKNIAPSAGSMSTSIRAATTPFRGSGARPASSSNTTVYKGDINTSAIFFDPPAELKGKINVVPEMNDVIVRRHHAISAASPAPTTRRC